MNRTILTSPAVSFYPNGRFPTHSTPQIHALAPCSALEQHYGQCFARSLDTQAPTMTLQTWFTALLSLWCGTPASGKDADDLPTVPTRQPAPSDADKKNRTPTRSTVIEPDKRSSDSNSAPGKRLYHIADVW